MLASLDPADMPPRIRALPRDARGYPVPYVVMIDREGTPQFTVNDTGKVAEAAHLYLCGICGQRLGAFKAFVGGPRSAFHPQGRYFDGPVHWECGAYALRVCPYLARAGRYTRRIGERKAGGKLPPGVVGLSDPTVHAPQPAAFVLASTRRFHMIGHHYAPQRPWAKVSYWRDGAEITQAEAQDLTRNDPNPACPYEELIWK